MKYIQSKEVYRGDAPLMKHIDRFNGILESLEQHKLQDPTREKIEQMVEELNGVDLDPKTFKKRLLSSLAQIKSLVKRQEGLVFRQDLQGKWVALGLTVGLLANFWVSFPFYMSLLIGLCGGLLVGKIQEGYAQKAGKLLS